MVIGYRRTRAPRERTAPPIANAIERLAAEQHVLEQEGDADRGSDPAASIGAWQVRAEKLLQSHPLEDSIDDGQAPIRYELSAGLARAIHLGGVLVERGTWRPGFGMVWLLTKA